MTPVVALIVTVKVPARQVPSSSYVPSILAGNTPVPATTVTATVALISLFSLEVQIILTFPSLTAVIFPFASTVAIFLSSEDHVTSLFVASLGKTVAVTVSDFPTSRLSMTVLSKVIEATFTLSFTTIVTSFFTPFSPVKVIVVVPANLATT